MVRNRGNEQHYYEDGTINDDDADLQPMPHHFHRVCPVVALVTWNFIYKGMISFFFLFSYTCMN